MKVEIFTLCDAATVDASGKLNILGTFDRMWLQATPAIYPLCTLAIKIRFTQIEEGVKRIRISFTDADGHLIMPRLDAQTQIQIGPNETSATTQMVMVIPQLRLPSFGDYSLGLAIDGMEAATFLLSVRQTPLTQPQPPAPQIQPPQQQ